MLDVQVGMKSHRNINKAAPQRTLAPPLHHREGGGWRVEVGGATPRPGGHIYAVWMRKGGGKRRVFIDFFQTKMTSLSSVVKARTPGRCGAREGSIFNLFSCGSSISVTDSKPPAQPSAPQEKQSKADITQGGGEVHES